MNFDPDNKIIQLCAKGMGLQQKPDEAKVLFLQAWNEAMTDVEKFIAAHYVARHQVSIADKLKWDEAALAFALKINEEEMKETYPSLYLNIGKGYEDLNELEKAIQLYQIALLYISHLPENSYGQIIKSGIQNGLERIAILRVNSNF